MVEILRKSSEELTKKDCYNMTRGAEIKSVKDIEDGTIINPVKFVIFNDVKEDGEVAEILSIMDVTGAVCSTQSKTFKGSFLEIVELMEGEDFEIKKLSGTTKAGRPYVNCTLA